MPKRIYVQLSEDIYEKVLKKSHKEDRSKSKICQMIIEKEVKNECENRIPEISESKGY